MEEKLMEQLEELNEFNLLDLWNEYCSNICDYESYIYNMCEIDNVLEDLTPTEIIDKLDDDFSLNADYFINGIYGVRSFDHLAEEIELSDLVNYILANPEEIDLSFYGIELED